MKFVQVFSRAVILSALVASAAAAQPSVQSLSPNAGTGFAQTFSVVVNVPGGEANLNNLQLRFNGGVPGGKANGCSVSYDEFSHSIGLYSDDGNSLVGSSPIGSPGGAQNSQCRLDASGVGISSSSDLVTLNVPLTFYGRSLGRQDAYVYVQANDESNNGGFQLEGTWTVPPGPPTVVSVTPVSGSGSTQTFMVVVTDPNGRNAYGDLNNIELLINSTPDRADGCDVNFTLLNPGSADYHFELANNAGTSYQDYPPGGVQTLSNSQCTMNGESGGYPLYDSLYLLGPTSDIGSGHTVALIISLTFSPTFTGQKNIYVYTQELGQLDNGGFQQVGTLTLGSAPSVVSLTPSSGVGTSHQFSMSVIDPNGIADVNNIQLLFNSSQTRVSGCDVTYDVYSHTLSLHNDAGDGYAGSIPIASSSQVSNSQCTLSGTGSSYPSAGNQGTLTFGLSFAPSFPGTKNAYTYVQGNDGLNSGWVFQGNWAPSAPAWIISSLTPSSGHGSVQTFRLLATSPITATLPDLNNLQLLLNTSVTRPGACNVSYDVYTDVFSLYNDDGTGFIGSLPAGSVDNISNRQCTLYGAGSALAGREGTSTISPVELNVALSFSPTFNTRQNLYAYVQDNSGANTGWVQEGTWISPTPPTISSVSPNSGSGTSQTFTLTGTDPSGNEMNNLQLLFNGTPQRPNGCNVSYDVYSNALSLYNDAGTGSTGGVTPGSSDVISNSQCTLSGVGSSWNAADNSFSLSVQLTFSSTFTGQQNIYGYVQGNGAGPYGTWIPEGTWAP